MTNMTEFFKTLQHGVYMNLNTAMPCKVLAYDETKRRAKIQPLFKVKEYGQDESSLAPIENVPVLFQRYKVHNNQPIPITTDTAPHPQYTGTGEHVHNEITFTESVEMIPDLKNGDIVQVIFNQRAIDEAQNGQNVYPGTARMFDIHDAVIVGVF
ncbi:hypothetical protein FCT18_14795 [Lysinibacillus sphaericus]|uniref:Uncharacterized protein n=1 Tax=Lysinibacillus sphaericus TaxID=1421 RepID=A0A2S0K673_LYSSH|nr:Gp138 family membrane-puncturing spike protein [Lysinibacillus sphaericus]AVK98836.1 hypothetical protein LS41612_22370 [Lysinibacillus sphaericus]MED4545303.1 Gp138 family membrane-puncturing spike protein [Lysinibacillus sphaericus]TKI18362.1 hypothetical protein FCT18_14795 [Lysinibacillus sphaericus]SUV15148.1 Uncharacterised protein [Lysinibacillus sphaericus]GEC82190.1 hypothetical protein LSP03_19330 [Lysinibacillus sphaericus]